MSLKYRWLLTLPTLVGCRQDTPPAPTYPQSDDTVPVAPPPVPTPAPGPIEGPAQEKDPNECVGTDCIAVSKALQKQCVDFGFSTADCNRAKWPQEFYDRVVAKAKEIALGSCVNRRVEASGGLNLRETASNTSKVVVVLDNKTPLTVVEAPANGFVKVTTQFKGKTYTGYVALNFAPCSDGGGATDAPVISVLNCTVVSPSSDVEIASVACYAGQKLVKSFPKGTQVQASSALYTFPSKPGVDYRQLTVDKTACYVPEKYLQCKK